MKGWLTFLQIPAALSTMLNYGIARDQYESYLWICQVGWTIEFWLCWKKPQSVSYFFSASSLATSQGEQQCSFPIHVLCTICFEYLVYSNTKAIFSFYFGKTLVGIRENWGHYSTIKPQINRQKVFKWLWNACIDKPISIILPSATGSEIINILRISK